MVVKEELESSKEMLASDTHALKPLIGANCSGLLQSPPLVNRTQQGNAEIIKDQSLAKINCSKIRDVMKMVDGGIGLCCRVSLSRLDQCSGFILK